MAETCAVSAVLRVDNTLSKGAGVGSGLSTGGDGIGQLGSSALPGCVFAVSGPSLCSGSSVEESERGMSINSIRAILTRLTLTSFSRGSFAAFSPLTSYQLAVRIELSTIVDRFSPILVRVFVSYTLKCDECQLQSSLLPKCFSLFSRNIIRLYRIDLTINH